MTEAAAPSASPRNGPAAWASVLWRVLRYAARDAVLAPVLGVLVLVALVAVLGPVLWRLDPLAVDLASALQPPSGSHPMGTDGNGRDVLARYIHGSRISLAVGMVVVVAGLVVGGAIGLVAGISNRLIDSALMRVIDALAAFPPLILAMAITVGLGVGLETAVLGVTLSTVPYYARLIRSDVIRIRAQPSVEAAVALGASRSRVVFRHIVPHTTSTMLIQSAAVFGYAILTLAALGFVGLGLQVPEAEWGAMITDGLQYALTGEWWIAVFPGLGVLITVVAANMLADRARDILDPRGPQASVS